MSSGAAVRTPSTGSGPTHRRLTSGEKRSLVGMFAFIALLHVLGWGTLVGIVAPRQYAIGDSGVLGVAVGLVAYTLGMRHAFDADHIAAIDNTTRKLMAERHRPMSVGFWFSLGHSTIVFVLVALIALGVRALAGQVADEGSILQRVTGVFGVAVSGIFLMVIGILNLVVLIGIIAVFRRMRRGEYDEAALERQLNNRGFLNRILSGVTKAVRRPWHMYPVGVLFGLGFDTATEIGLLVLAGGAAAFSLPWYAILTLPILFAAGMSLLDTLDGVFMNVAYGWAFAKPVRKVYYNITVTSLSVAVALGIGGIELISILVGKAGIESGPLAAIAAVDLTYVGYGIVAFFVLAWLVSLGFWRFGRVEEKWSARLQPTDSAAS
ncbi:MAG TPA: HoxN/HupN/NixA family nickel/cobalt transporter [Propionibacteriaceae bacterium]|nr:HoxN/HupN/NixA family nickel/cobalt transporter [Propionibacteriaceae bacterium]